MIAVEIIWTMFMLTGAGVLFLDAYEMFMHFLKDNKIYRKGRKISGTCTEKILHGKSMYLSVVWTEENQEYTGEYLALSKPRKFPYPVTVYQLKEKTCLGIYSLIYDGFWFVVFFLAGLVSLLTVFQTLWKFLNL